MKQAAFIVSYFGADRSSKLHSKRMEYHKRQLEWLCTDNAIDRVYVYAQVYNDADFCLYLGEGHEKVHYIESDTPNHPGFGRNLLLTEFYNSDYDWAHFIDNDSILYGHMFGKDFFSKFAETENNKLMTNVAGFRPIIPRHEAFSGEYKAQKDTRDGAFMFTRDNHLKGSFFSIRNFNKFDDVEIYMDDKMFQMEDDEFALAMLKEGLIFYKCHNIVLNEMANGDYSVLFSDQDRMQDVSKWKEYIVKKYADMGLKLNSKGNVDRKGMTRKFKALKEVIVPLQSIGLDDFFA